jgi:hypothetical protein
MDKVPVSISPNLVPYQNHENAPIINCSKSWVFPKFCAKWGHLELTMDIVIRAA